jgi:hypothetical protein
MRQSKSHWSTIRMALMATIALSVTACGFDSNPNKCSAIPESKGQAVAKKAVMQFLRYAGKTHAPITGDGGTLDVAKLERISDSDLIYDKRSPVDASTYQFHLQWAPNAIFTGTVAGNCSVTTNWSVK